MALEKVYLDPNATTYTDDDIVGKVNAATANITRAGSVEAAARPIESGEVDTTELATGAVDNTILGTGIAKDNLDAMADLDRSYIQSRPVAGQKKIVAIQTHSDGTQEIEQNDTAEV